MLQDGKLQKHPGHELDNPCDYVAPRIYNLNRPKEAMHKGVIHQCDECEHHATTSHSLKQHKEVKHEGLG